MRKLTIAALTLMGIFAIGQAALAADATVDEIKKGIGGNTLHYVSPSNKIYKLLYTLGGEVVIVIKESTFTDRGKWWVPKNGILCSKYNKIAKGKERCSTNVHFSADGSLTATNVEGKTATYKILKGNQTSF